MPPFTFKDFITFGLQKQQVPNYGEVEGKKFPEKIPQALVTLCFFNSLVKLTIPLVLEETYSSLSVLNSDPSSYIGLIILVIASIAISQLLTIVYTLILTLYRLNAKRELSIRILRNNFQDYRELLESKQIDELAIDYDMELRIKISTKVAVYLHNYYESYLSLIFQCFNIAVIFIYLLYKLSFSLFFGVAIAGMVMTATIKIANKINTIKFQNIERRARRLKILEAFFSRITQFKMCWLDKWVHNKIKNLEDQYQSGLRAIKMLDCWCVALWQFTSIGISSVVIIAYYLLGLHRNQQSIFSPSTFVYLLNMLNFPLNALSWYIAGIRTAKQAIREIKKDIRIYQQPQPTFKKIQEYEKCYTIEEPLNLTIYEKSHEKKPLHVPLQELPKGKIYSVSGPYSQKFMDKLIFLVGEQTKRGFVQENSWLNGSVIQSVAMEHNLLDFDIRKQSQIVQLMQLFCCGDIPLSSATSNYSGGQKLRISLTRAFNLGQLIVINSNLSSLDHKTREMVKANIRKLVNGCFTQLNKTYTVFIRDNLDIADSKVTLKEQNSQLNIYFNISTQDNNKYSQSEKILLSPEIAKYNQDLTIFLNSARQKAEKRFRRYSVGKLQQIDIKEDSVVSWKTFRIYYKSIKHIIFLVSIIGVTAISNYYNFYLNTYLSLAEYHPHQLMVIIGLTLLFALGLFFRSYYFADANLDESLRICHALDKNVLLNQLSQYNSDPKNEEDDSTNSKSRLVCVLTSDAETIADHFPFSANIFANNVVVILSSMVVIVWQVPAMLLLMGLLIAYANRLNNQSHRKDEFLKIAMKEKDVQIYHIMSEIQEGKKYVLIHRKLDSFIKVFSQKQEQLYALDWLNEKFKNYINFKYKAVMVGFLAIAVIIYSLSVANIFGPQKQTLQVSSQESFTGNQKSSSGLALLIQYTTQLSNYLLFFTMSVWQIKGQAVSIERARPFLYETPSIRNRINFSSIVIQKIKQNKGEMKHGEIMLELKDLQFGYQKNQSTLIFNNLNFKLKKGEKIVIKGKSGIGKTTLYKLLTSTYPSVLSTVDSPFFVAFSPQHPLILPDTHTVRQNLTPYLDNYSDQKINPLMEKWGLKSQLAMSELTYEQKIVVNNLRAYLQGSKGVVLYDEPQEVIASAEETYLIVTHHRDFPHTERLVLQEGCLVVDSDTT